MNIDIKVTSWERITIPEQIEKEVVKMLKDGHSIMDIIGKYKDLYVEQLEYTSEFLEVEDNGGNPTVELLDDEGEIIWDNANGETTDVQ